MSITWGWAVATHSLSCLLHTPILLMPSFAEQSSSWHVEALFKTLCRDQQQSWQVTLHNKLLLRPRVLLAGHTAPVQTSTLSSTTPSTRQRCAVSCKTAHVQRALPVCTRMPSRNCAQSLLYRWPSAHAHSQGLLLRISHLESDMVPKRWQSVPHYCH